jgi:hypothetical protein
MGQLREIIPDQLKKIAEGFAALTIKSANDTGWYQFSRNESAAGTYYYRTTFAGNATFRNATSNVVKATIKKISTTVNATAPQVAAVKTPFVVAGVLKANGTGFGNQ